MLRTIWGSVLVVGLIWYWVVNLVNAPPQPCGKTPDYSIVVGHLVPLTLFHDSVYYPCCFAVQGVYAVQKRGEAAKCALDKYI